MHDQLIIRPLHPDEGAALLDLFCRLSPQSRYQRFLAPKPRLAAAELARLSDVDGDRHDAVVAAEAAAPGRLLGVARLVRSAVPGSADLSVVVEDGWQRQGLGRRLVDALFARARARGIDRISASVLAENRAGLRLAQAAGRLLDVRLESGVVELVMALEPA